MPQEACAIPLAPPCSPHLSLAPARTRVYLYVLSFGGFKPNPPWPQSALRRPPRPRAVAASRSPPPLPPSRTDSPAKLCPKSTGADVRRVLIATASGHRNRALRAPRATSRTTTARHVARVPRHAPHTRKHDNEVACAKAKLKTKLQKN